VSPAQRSQINLLTAFFSAKFNEGGGRGEVHRFVRLETTHVLI
jgi:hypothetical protein